MSGLERLNRWLISIPIWVYTVIMGVAIIVKSGLSFAPLDASEFQNFPLPPNYWPALSYGMRSLVYGTGQTDSTTFGIIGLLLVLITIITITFLAKQALDPVAARLFILFAIVGPIGMVLFNRIGQNDVFVILGAVLITFLGMRWFPFLIGLTLMLLGNPEQTVVALSVLLLLSGIPRLKVWRRRAIAGLLISLVVFLFLSSLARSVGAKSRLEYLPDYLSNSFYAFAANLPLSLYAAFGAFWLIAAWIFVHLNRNERIWLVVGLVLAPLAVTMITVDQTRVFVGVSVLAVFILLKTYLADIKQNLDARGISSVIAAALIIVLFLPVIDIWGSDGHARTPYLWIFSSVVPQIKILILG